MSDDCKVECLFVNINDDDYIPYRWSRAFYIWIVALKDNLPVGI